ncbi:dTDP-glucose 4,6-dehydratase [Thermovibrio ammonificans HB-1]|uniref:dTDP-glucose 4,6-dehydratase n=1 Tax=Thermovibrio ammonificans (strain DSM 15698 / JCM 12110 / HB-1) TaxID=648996 RepID=E8T5W7_THEA1|nr:dTDP-glucose 4,6-dehydratase [Thermovibrio ammonificans]ADU96551.1 dTDP-glucose 4,6-dehydratase [Thermovibrio ammonificans HB-1]
MKLLVTGGAGFIGSEFVRQAVERGYDVCVLDALTYAGDLERLHSVEGRYRFYRVDLTDRSRVFNVLKEEKPDVVVHFAAESHVDRSIVEPTVFVTTNVLGTQNLLDAAVEAGVEKFVNISTDEVYGEIAQGRFTEESPLNPSSPYSASKAAADMLGRAYHRTFGLPVVTVRPSNNYGPWQYPEKLIPVVVLKALLNEPIPVYGDGSNVREWLFVSDCARAVFAAVEKGEPGRVYNVGSSQEKRNIEVVKAILSILGKPESLITFVKDRPGHDYRYALDWERARRELGWEPAVKFEEGIERTVKWLVENRDWLERKLSELRSFWNRVYGGNG